MSRTLLGESNRSSVPASDARGVYHPAPVLDEPYGVDVLAPAYELPDGRTNFRYSMTREEMLKGLANRFVHSTTYLYPVSYTHLTLPTNREV